MAQIIYGWVGEKDIYEVLKNNFSEEDQKKIHNILHYSIQKTLPDKKPIKPNKGINNWTPEVYKKEKLENNHTFISTLYKLSFSAYHKLNSLQKYIDIINCKYAINLNINFYYNQYQNYIFILYFGNHSQHVNKYLSTIDFDKVNEYTKTWNRVKDVLQLDPKICCLA